MTSCIVLTVCMPVPVPTREPELVALVVHKAAVECFDEACAQQRGSGQVCCSRRS